MAAASGGGAWNLSEKGVRDVAGLRVEGWSSSGEDGAQARKASPGSANVFWDFVNAFVRSQTSSQGFFVKN